MICLVDILFIVNGRTGQIMVLIINAFLVLFRFKLRGTLLLLLAVIIIAPLLWISPIIQKGLYNYRHDISQYEQGNHWTSYGARKEFHKQSIKLIKDKPILGYGTGSFGKVYKAQNEMRHEPITSNPHRDILWIGVELGVVGICLFIYMLFSFIFACLKLDNLYYKCMGLSLIIGYIVASTENSFFIDNVTGMAFIFIILAILSTKIKIK
jgi:O-antigen ligase